MYPHLRSSQEQVYAEPAPSEYGRGGGGYASNGRGRGRGGGRGGGYGFVRTSVTGANDTPLGTPSRLSPATVTPPEPISIPAPVEPTKTEVNGKGREKVSKRKNEEAVTVSPFV